MPHPRRRTGCACVSRRKSRAASTTSCRSALTKMRKQRVGNRRPADVPGIRTHLRPGQTPTSDSNRNQLRRSCGPVRGADQATGHGVHLVHPPAVRNSRPQSRGGPCNTHGIRTTLPCRPSPRRPGGCRRRRSGGRPTRRAEPGQCRSPTRNHRTIRRKGRRPRARGRVAAPRRSADIESSHHPRQPVARPEPQTEWGILPFRHGRCRKQILRPKVPHRPTGAGHMPALS